MHNAHYEGNSHGYRNTLFLIPYIHGNSMILSFKPGLLKCMLAYGHPSAQVLGLRALCCEPKILCFLLCSIKELNKKIILLRKSDEHQFFLVP